MEKTKKILGVIIVAMAIIAGLTMKEDIMDKLNLEADHIRDLRLVDSLEQEGFKDFNLYDNLILLSTSEELKYYNKDKENFASIGIHEKEVAYGKDQIYIVDKAHNSFKIIGLDGEEKDNIFFERRQLYNLAESNDSLVAHFKKNDFETIEILDKNAKNLRNHSVEKTSILTYDVNYNGYIISELNTNRDIFRSEVRHYDMGGEMNYELMLEEEIVMKTILLSKDSAIVQTDERIYSLQDGEIVWENKIDNIERILYGEDKIYLLYSKTLEVMDMDGHVVSKLGLEKNYREIISYKDYIILYGDRNILGLKEDKKILEYLSDDQIISIDASSNSLGLQVEDQIDLYEIIRKSNIN